MSRFRPRRPAPPPPRWRRRTPPLSASCPSRCPSWFAPSRSPLPGQTPLGGASSRRVAFLGNWRGGRVWLNAAVLKTARGRQGPSGVRIPPPPLTGGLSKILRLQEGIRSEERRVGKEGGRG